MWGYSLILGVNMSTKIAEVLKEREGQHGSFEMYAQMMCEFDLLMESGPSLEKMIPPQTQAVRMIFSKLARILCGDPNLLDHWIDIQGYARLAEDSTARYIDELEMEDGKMPL
jgi:hypothetical protein